MIFMTFILCRRAHTLTVLFILTCALVYVTLLEETPQDTTYNTKRSVSTRLQNGNCKFPESFQALSFNFHSSYCTHNTSMPLFWIPGLFLLLLYRIYILFTCLKESCMNEASEWHFMFRLVFVRDGGAGLNRIC